jgi:phosphoglycolate phosphatase-like HAD superfamily hydrolase
LFDFFSNEIAGWGVYRTREEILRDAIAQGEAAIGGKFDWTIHVGDTPDDVAAANAVGALGVLVMTSSHKYGEDDVPRECSVLSNLEDEFEEFLRIVRTGVHKNRNV